MNKKDATALAILALLGGFVATTKYVERHHQPQSHVARLAPGMSHAEVIDTIPAHLIAAALHPVDGTRFEFGRVSMERKGIQATQMLVLHDTLWPISQATVCFLYFNEEDILVDWYLSAS